MQMFRPYQIVIVVLTGSIVIFLTLTSVRKRSQGTVTRGTYDCGDHRLAIIIPFRNVFDELMELAPNLHRFLNAQCVEHEFYIINQADAFRFNKGSLINIGYLVSRNECDYMAIHDVDLLPLNSEIKYSFPDKGPLHIASPEYHPFLSGETYIGGIILMTMEHFNQIHGMTNKIWGWGGEDNELYMRIMKENLTIFRPSGLKTGKASTFKNLHNEAKRSRDKQRFLSEHKNVFKVEPKTGFHDVEYHLISRVRITIEDCPMTIFNVGLKCDPGVDKWCSTDI